VSDKVKRPPGAGSVEAHRGKFRARVRVAGRKGKPTLGIYDTEPQAHQALDQYYLDRAARDGESAGKVTLKTITERFLTARELSGLRGVSIERDRWNAHIVTSHIADYPLDEITAKDIRTFRDRLQSKQATKSAAGGKRVAARRKVSRSTVKNTLNLLRKAFEWAVEDDIIATNPAYGVKLKRDLRTDEPWTYLTPDEQRALITCEDIPLPERLIIQFAIGTGMRKGELWCLRREDVHESGDNPRVYVRFGSPGKPPKNGKPRWVPMTAMALDACKRWLAIRTKYAKRNPLGLMFPTRRGCRRWKRIFRAEWHEVVDGKTKRVANKVSLLWPDMLLAAGIIGRPVRFHDLRHTCGSSLVAGWWGEPWTLISVRDLLGHAQISTTERYAHLAVSALAKAAQRTSMPGPQAAHALDLDANTETT
jgi:integrase